MPEHAIIIGVGDGLSASCARLFAKNGYAVHLAARSEAKMAPLAAEIGAKTTIADGADPDAVARLFDAVPGRVDVVIYNPSARTRGPITELEPDDVRNAMNVTAFGSFLAGQAAAQRMLAQDEVNGRRGTILFTGASAGVKGFPQSAPFAMGKFAQRGLAQSMSRELHPKGIHVAWINVDGAIRNPGQTEAPDNPDSKLDPDAIAQTYLNLVNQDRSTWSHEISLRPWVERF